VVAGTTMMRYQRWPRVTVSIATSRLLELPVFRVCEVDLVSPAFQQVPRRTALKAKTRLSAGSGSSLDDQHAAIEHRFPPARG